MVKDVIQNKFGIKINVYANVKTHWTNMEAKKDNVWNPSINLCEFNKKCKADECWNNCTYIKRGKDHWIISYKNKMHF